MLLEAATAYTAPGRPRGCLVAHAATNCSDPEVERSPRERRVAGTEAVESRIRADVAVGVLPADTDAAALARHTRAMLGGMPQQARDGAAREALEGFARIAMAVWPPAGTRRG